MKKEKLLPGFVLMLAATVSVNILNAQQNAPENLKNINLKKGSFFVKQSADHAEEKIYNFYEGMEAISGKGNGVTVKYIEQLVEDEISPFTQSIVKNHSGKNYLHWIVSNDSKNGIFVIERSENGSEFKTVGFKNRISSTVPRLSYYFQDESAEGVLLYRILAIGEDGSYKYSETLTVENITSSVQVLY